MSDAKKTSMTRASFYAGKPFGGAAKKRIIAVIAAVMLLLALALPGLAANSGAPKYATPQGYNENDYQKAVAFMETADADGVKNGQKIVSFYNGYYSPTDPEAWSWYYYDHENAILYLYGIFWTDDAERRVSAMNLYGMGLVGELDLSGMTELYEVYCDNNELVSINASGCSTLRALTCKSCCLTELDLSGCSGLDLFDCSGNRLTGLDASDCASITDIECADNELTSLNVSGCGDLAWLNCSNNRLTELDVSNNTGLGFLCCFGNRFSELDFTNNPELPFDLIGSEGAGSVGYSNYGYIDGDGYWVNANAAFAEPDPGEEFLGWYSESGALISDNAQLDFSAANTTRVIARFSGADAIPGDADGDGDVDITDALLALRCAMGLIQLSPEAEAACDVNSSGEVDHADALLILRFAIGVIDAF